MKNIDIKTMLDRPAGKTNGYKRLGKWLKHIREREGYPLKELENEIQVNQWIMRDIESGCLKITWEILERLSTLYNKPMEVIVGVQSLPENYECDKPIKIEGSGYTYKVL